MIKKAYLLMAVGIISSILLASCGKTTEKETIDINAPYDDIISGISYIDDGQTYHMLDIYGTQSVDSPTPVVIEVHGGGYIGGTKETNKDHSIYYAKSGYLVVAPDYTKVNEANGGTFTNAIQDLFTVYQWVEDNADKYNFDLNNIFLSGDSAGGYYTLLSCAIMNSEELQEYFGVTPPSFDFSSYITSCPGTDIVALQTEFNNGSFVATTIGEGQLFNTELMSHMDLYTNVDPEVFNGIYMMTTPTDNTTGPDVQKFETYLNENNIEHRYNSYDGTENELKHVFNIIQPLYVESIQANQDIVDYMDSLLK